MRKIISLGCLALLFSVFSSQLLASNADACDGVTKSKGLFGLCVAWHNANEKNKDKFAETYFQRSGEVLPGSEPETESEPEPDFFCPCWSELSFGDICSLGAPVFHVINRNEEGLVVFGLSDFFDDITGEKHNFDTFGANCSHTVVYPDGSFDPNDNEGNALTEDESLDCLAEIATIDSLHLDPICQ